MVMALVPLERIAVILLSARGRCHLVRLLLRHRAVFFALGLSLRVLRLAFLDRRPVWVGARLLRWYSLGMMRSSAFRVALAAWF